MGWIDPAFVDPAVAAGTAAFMRPVLPSIGLQKSLSRWGNGHYDHASPHLRTCTYRTDRGDRSRVGYSAVGFRILDAVRPRHQPDPACRLRRMDDFLGALRPH